MKNQADKAREAVRTYTNNPNVTTRWWAEKEIRKVENISMRFYLREIAGFNTTKI